MTPIELYNWAKENKCEDMDMVFVVGVGNEEIALDIDDIVRPTKNFNIYIALV